MPASLPGLRSVRVQDFKMIAACTVLSVFISAWTANVDRRNSANDFDSFCSTTPTVYQINNYISPSSSSPPSYRCRCCHRHRDPSIFEAQYLNSQLLCKVDSGFKLNVYGNHAYPTVTWPMTSCHETSKVNFLLKQTIRLYDRHLDYFKNTNSNLKLKTLTFWRQLTPSSELFVDSSPWSIISMRMCWFTEIMWPKKTMW